MILTVTVGMLQIKLLPSLFAIINECSYDLVSTIFFLFHFTFIKIVEVLDVLPTLWQFGTIFYIVSEAIIKGWILALWASKHSSVQKLYWNWKFK
jgi:hypothetical protein